MSRSFLYPHICRRATGLLIMLLIGCSSITAQNTDSLKLRFKEHAFDDTTGVNIIVQLVKNYKELAPDSAIKYANEGLALARKARYKNGEADCLYQLGGAYAAKDDYQQSLYYSAQAVKIYEQENNLKGLSAGLNQEATNYYRKNIIDSALSLNKQSAAVSEKGNDLAGMGKALEAIGNIYNDKGNFPEAITEYLKALKIFEKLDDRLMTSYTLGNIATVYGYLNDKKNALSYLEQSEAVKDVKGKSGFIISNLMNIGVTYNSLQEYGRALAAFKKAYRVADSINGHYWKNIAMGNVAAAYMGLKENDSALAMYNLMLNDTENKQDVNTMILAYGGKGQVLVQEKKYIEGISYYKKSLELLLTTGNKQNISELLQYMADAYEQAHDYKNALEYHKQYMAYKDSISNESTDKKLQQLQFDYQLDKKQGQIDILNKNKEIGKNKNERQRIILWSLAGGVVLLVAIVLLLIRSRKIGMDNNAVLKRKNEEIRMQATTLEELNGFKDKTFSVLSHDLRGPLSTFSATLDMLDSGMLSEVEYEQMRPEIKGQLNAISILLENLLQWSKTHMKGQSSTEPENINLYELCEKNVRLVKGMAQGKQIALQNNIDENTCAWADDEETDIVIRNLVTNAVKFTPDGGSITLSAVALADSVQLSVADTGVGMTAEQLEKVFMANIDNHSYGTNGEKGIGLGLLLCYEFVRLNNGSISVQSKVGKGTIFTVTLPKQEPVNS